MPDPTIAHIALIAAIALIVASITITIAVAILFALGDRIGPRTCFECVAGNHGSCNGPDCACHATHGSTR